MPERELKMVASAILLFACTIVGFLAIPFIAVFMVVGIAFMLFLRKLISPPAAGTVDNLAYLETLLDNLGIGAELGAVLLGVVLTCHALLVKNFRLGVMGKELKLERGKRCAVGVGLILCGLCPEASRYVLNWLMASARDANLLNWVLP